MTLTKKILSLLMAFAVAFTMYSCDEPNNETPNPDDENTETPETPNDEPEDDGIIKLTSYFSGYYFGNFWDDGIGGYYFILTNDTKLGLNAAMQEVPMTPGCWLLCVELWGDLSADSANAIVPEGTYNFAQRHGEKNIFTAEYTVATYNAEKVGELYRIQNTFFKDGTITVEHTEAGYKLVANLISTDDKEMKFVYEGTITMEDQSDDEIFDPNVNQDLTIEPIYATYYTYETTEDYSNVVLILFDTTNISYDGMHLNEPGLKLHLDLYTEPNAGIAGTYTAGELNDKGMLVSKEAGLFYPGRLYSSIALGSHVELVNNDEQMSVEYGVIVDGTLNITDNGDGTHTIVGEFTTSKETSVSCNWTGVVEPYAQPQLTE